MKEKIIIFLSGLLLGAIISTGSIYIYTVANNSNNIDQNMQMPNNQDNMIENFDNNRPEMPNNIQNNN